MLLHIAYSTKRSLLCCLGDIFFITLPIEKVLCRGFRLSALKSSLISPSCSLAFRYFSAWGFPIIVVVSDGITLLNGIDICLFLRTGFFSCRFLRYCLVGSIWIYLYTFLAHLSQACQDSTNISRACIFIFVNICCFNMSLGTTTS